MSDTRKSWATAYLTERRQPRDVQGGGQWTAGSINPAARQQLAEARNQAMARTAASSSGGGAGGDAEDQRESAAGSAAARQATELDTQIGQLKNELKTVTRQYNQLTGNQPPGQAPGASTGAPPNNAATAAAARSYQRQVSQLQSQQAQLRTQIARLTRQRAQLLARAQRLQADARKSASPERNRVPVLAPESAKAATLDGQEVVHVGLADIAKWEDGPDGSLYVYGRASTPEVDTDDQIVDSDWSGKALQAWLDEAPALRVQHNGQRDPAGSGVALQINRDGDGAHWVQGVVDEPVAQRLVKKGHLRAFSVGIAKPVIERDPAGKARGGVIKAGRIVEVSLVDSPANRSCFLEIAKAAGDDGHAEFTGKLTGGTALLTKDAKPRGTVTVELPKDVSVSIKPSDLAKLTTFRQRLVKDQQPAVTKTATPAPATPEPEDAELAAIKAAEAPVWKRDIDTATRRRLAAEGKALPNLSYPIETAEDLQNAATLARSGHGDTAAAKKLIGRRARSLGVPNPLAKKPKAEARKAAQAAKRETARARKAVRAALAEPDAIKKKGKLRALCPGCGAKQNPAHVHCPECGAKLPGGALQVEKNHDFTCLSCGKNLDKGEKHCPQCGRENPGYLAEADKKIPANKNGKARVGKGKKGKKGSTPAGASSAAGEHGEDAAPLPAASEGVKEVPAGAAKAAAGKNPKGKKGKKGKGKPFGGSQAPPFGNDEDADDDAKAGKAATADPELRAALHLKTLGIPLAMGAAHDLTCPAYDPADTRAAWPAASLAALDLGMWQGYALHKAATGTLAEAREAQALLQATATLRTADPRDLADIRDGAHKAFRDANPGPGTFPRPGEIAASRYNRPLLHDGQQAASPGHDGPNRHPLPPEGGIHPEQFRRGFLPGGRADDSPANDSSRSAPMQAPDRTGAPTSGPGRSYYRNSVRESAEHAMRIMHDHISQVFPDLCPMHIGDNIASHPVPTPEGVPDAHPAPGTRGLGKNARDAKARKQARAAKRKAAAKARTKRRALEARVLKGKLTVNEARQKLGLEPVDAVAKAALQSKATAPQPAADTAALREAIEQATAPLISRLAKADKAIGRQARMLRKVRRTTDAIAAQPDTAAAPFRGVTLAKKTSTAPAGPLTVAKSAEQAQAALMTSLYDQWRNSPNPELREAAWTEITKRQLDPAMTRPQT